jgi:hypothetical protein
MPGTVTDAQTAAVRAYLVDSRDECVRLTAQLSDADMPGYENLVLAALVVLAHRVFPSYTSARVVQAVALLRTRVDPAIAEDIDPIAAEAVLRWTLGEHISLPADPETRFPVAAMLLAMVAEGQHLAAADIGDMLAEARSIADGWLQTRQ